MIIKKLLDDFFYRILSKTQIKFFDIQVILSQVKSLTLPKIDLKMTLIFDLCTSLIRNHHSDDNYKFWPDLTSSHYVNMRKTEKQKT